MLFAKNVISHMRWELNLWTLWHSLIIVSLHKEQMLEIAWALGCNHDPLSMPLSSNQVVQMCSNNCEFYLWCHCHCLTLCLGHSIINDWVDYNSPVPHHHWLLSHFYVVWCFKVLQVYYGCGSRFCLPTSAVDAVSVPFLVLVLLSVNVNSHEKCESMWWSVLGQPAGKRWWLFPCLRGMWGKVIHCLAAFFFFFFVNGDQLLHTNQAQ